jgi:hypothetical protein
VELPFTVVFEPPSRAELRVVLRMRRAWVAGVLVALAIGTLVLVPSVGHTDAAASDATVPVQLTSRPAGAAVWLDGHQRGRTPLEVRLEPGTHAVLLKAPDALDGQYAVQIGSQPAALEAVLWRRQPALARLRPSLPGAVLADVRLLADGELALSIAMPPSRQLQAWRLDPVSGALEPLLTDVTGTRLMVAPDGQHVALVGYEFGPPAPGDAAGFGSPRASVLWLLTSQHPASITGWRPSLASGEQLVDASWSPRAERLLVVSSQAQGGGAAHSRLWLVDAGGQRASDVLSLPSEVVPGSATWSPDGEHVALLAHAGVLNALCLIDLAGGFHYVADLDPSLDPPLAYSPATWAADSQRLLFVAPADQHPPGAPFGWLQPDGRHGLYVASTTDPTPLLIRDTDVDFAAWREDGQIVGLGRSGADRALAMRLLDGSGGAQRLLDLPLRPAANYVAVWDLPRARLLLASPTAAGGIDYWLATLGLEGTS